MIAINFAERMNIASMLPKGLTASAWVKGATFDEGRPVAYLARFESNTSLAVGGPRTTHTVTIFGKGKNVLSNTRIEWPTPQSRTEWKTHAWLLADLAEKICTKTVEVTHG